jgi:hypothetical protein
MGALGNLAVSMSNKAATAPAPARRAALRWWRPHRRLATLNCIGETLSRPRPWQAEIASAGGVGAVVAGMLQHVGNTRLQARPQRRAIAFRAAVWRYAALQMLAPRRPKCR